MQKRTRITDRNIELADFKGINGYIERLFRRTKVHKSIRLHGRSGSALPESHEARIREIREIASEYELKDVYNIDESGLFYRMDPRKPYFFPSEDPHLARGTDLLRQQARINIVLRVNADGSHRVPVACIGHSAEKFCFRDHRFDEYKTNYSSQLYA